MSKTASPVAQFVFDLSLPPALGPEDFIVADSNREAAGWIARWPDWPGPVLALHGAPGAGKSHLLGIWAQRAGARILAGGALAAADPAEIAAAGVVALDDADRVAGDAAAERALLHLHNLLKEAGGFLLLAAREPPARWPVALPDLASRLKAAPAVGLGEPDDVLLAQVLAKLFADRQLAVGPEIVQAMLARMERSFSEARRLVAEIDAASLAQGRSITLPLVRSILAQQG